MPARVADRRRARASGAAVSAKSSTQTLRSRNSRSARTSANAVEIPDEGESTSLREHVCRVFTDAQRTTATQRKLVVQLRKMQESCCYEPVKPRKGQNDEDFGEEDFNREIARCILRVLPIKKSEPVGDKTIRFFGLFLKHANEKDNEIARNEDPDASSLPETPTSRLTCHVISQILPLLTAKDKVVRFRVTQIISHVLNMVDTIDDELFQLVRLGLLKRLRDKEPQVRVQAVMGLGRLADEGDEQEDEDSDDGESGSHLLEKLLYVLQNDPAAEVRRSLLLNLPLTPSTLPYLLERARDLDPGTRRALYSRLLPALGDFRHLSLTHREKLLRWGMRDRDENVRKATARLFRERWIEDCAGLPEATQDGNAVKQLSKPTNDALLELLERIDVVNSGVEGGVAHEAMKEFWDGRPDYCDAISFADPFWDEMTPESAFVARSFNDYCRASGDSRLQSLVEDKMPEVTKYGYLIQKHINKLIEGVQKVASEEEDPEAEEDTVQQEFCVEQLLHIALTLDYTDEIGRRKMFSAMREALAIAELPEECTKLVAEVLRNVCGDNVAGEREFCGIVLEAIADVHDTIMGEDETKDDDDNESFHSAQSEVEDSEMSSRRRKKRRNPDMTEEELEAEEEEKAIREIMVNMKCLHIAQCMLQNVQCDLESNSALVTMLNNLVVPAVRSQEAPIRERGFLCLGLCCLLSKNIAQENLALFLHCFAKGHEALQTIALQIITDILTTHPSLLAPPPQPADPDTSEVIAVNPLLKPVHKMFLKAVKSGDASVATTGAVAASKLMLLNTLRDPDLLKALTIAYFNPESQHNPGLRQALTYFLPVYCHSRKENAERMASIAVSVIHALMGVQEELDEEGDVEMVGLGVVGSQIADWTDPRKLVGAEEMGGKLVSGETKVEGLGDAHLVLAEELLEKMLTPGCSKDEKKTFVSMLAKIHVHSTCSAEKVQSVTDLVNEALDSRAAADATSRNALNKLLNGLAKLSAPADKADTSGTVQDQEEPGKDDDQTTMDGRDDDDQITVDGKGNEEAASVVDASEAVGAPSVAGDEMSGVEDNEDTVIQNAPMGLSLEEQIQQQLQEETMYDVDAEGTVMPEGDEMDIDEEEDKEDEEEEEEEEEEKGVEEEEDEEDDDDTVKEPTPPPPPPPKKRGRKKKEPEVKVEPEAEAEFEPEPEPEPKPVEKKRRGRAPGSGRNSGSGATPAKRTSGGTASKRGSGGATATASGSGRGRGRPKKTKDVVDELLDSDDE